MASGSPVEAQLAWIVDQLNGGGANLTEAAIAERLNDDFAAGVPPADMLALFQQLAAIGPFEIESYSQSDDGLRASAILAGATGERVATELAVEPEPPHRLLGLTFQPAGAAGTPEPLAGWEDLDQRLSALAPAINFLAAEVVDGECVPVHGLNAETRLAVGSAFKLYILGELGDQVRAGEAEWDEPLALRDEWKFTFVRDMSAIPAGEERPLREFAAQMISVSDNTATNHLLFHLGRENVEAMQATMGHGEPELNQPMLSTLEWAQLKFAAPDELAERYRGASVEERRELLETEISGLTINAVEAAGQQTPLRIDLAEWFASAEDLCHAMATLNAWAAEPGLEPIKEILAIVPGIQVDPAVWPYVGFKGGSELGVLNGTWLLGHADGRTFVLTATLNNPEAAIDEASAIAHFQAAAQLLTASV